MAFSRRLFPEICDHPYFTAILIGCSNEAKTFHHVLRGKILLDVFFKYFLAASFWCFSVRHFERGEGPGNEVVSQRKRGSTGTGKPHDFMVY